MTGNFLLDWAIVAVSLFNTILLLWLGLTVLLNADRRGWGIWLVGGGLLIGGAFFVSHTAILGYGLHTIGQGLNFWWRAGWLPVVIAPLTWYVAMLWYSGFWEGAPVGENNRPSLSWQRPWLGLTVLLAVGLVALLLFANPLPSFVQITQLRLSVSPEIGGIPLLVLVYPLYILLCIGLSLAAQRRPVPSGRVMGDLARRRARPWLVTATMLLLLVSLLVAWVMLWIVLNVPAGHVADMSLTIGWFDLVIDLLIALVVILMGRAIVSYEVFTGKTLPRRGFFRHWRSAVILAAGYGLVIGATIAIQLRPIYSLLLTTILLSAFFALFSWRSFVERDHSMRLLRPFVSSQGLYEQLLTSTLPLTGAPAGQERESFRALCANILGARLAYLIPLGPLAPLVGTSLTYPDHTPPLPHSLAPLLLTLSPQTMSLPLNPADYGGALWAVPLWSERGLVGVLLLGEKRDGGLYTQEEMEIAQASGERLIDTQASAELGRRLMALQRQRLAQTGILDRQTRRVLHDDILPGLHTAMLMLAADRGPEAGDHGTGDKGQETRGSTPDPQPVTPIPHHAEAVTLLADLHHHISDLLREMPVTVTAEVGRLGLVEALHRIVDDELSRAFDEVAWQVEPAAVEKARIMPPLTAEVLFYAAREAIRNAARHGRAEASAPLHLKIAVAWRNGLEIIVEDNGVGVGTAGSVDGGSEFRPGLSTEAQPEGSGRGLALHSTMMAVVGGTLAMESVPALYTRVILTLPSEAMAGLRA
jgi:anti-sigma regulatory factor (Ser/Thr protein kinase)